MIFRSPIYMLLLLTTLLVSCSKKTPGVITLHVYPDSVVNDISNHPIGINLSYFMDGGRFPNPERTVTEALREMGVRYLRYPGGEKSDLYMFSAPPYKKSNPTVTRTIAIEDYPGMFTPDGELVYDPLDFDEFMELCHSLHAEPIIVVAADRYLLPEVEGKRSAKREALIEHAAEWVRYANITKKYGVRYWMIGNESWNKNNINSNADIYAQDVIAFSKAMKAVDSSILIIPNGESDEFFKAVITQAGDYIDRLCVSNYGVFDFHEGYQTYSDSTKCLIWPAQTALNAMNKYATQEQLDRWKMIVAEYGTIDWFGLWKGTNDMGHAIVSFDMTGQLLMEPQIEFSCFWNTRWIENENRPLTDHDALDMNGNINPTGVSLKIWGNYLGKQMVKSESDGSIITYSSIDKEQQLLYVYVINKKETPCSLRLEIESNKTTLLARGWEYFGNLPDDVNPVWQSKTVNGEYVDLKGYSITVLEYKLK
ncbi:hypothetical protein [Bacteroides sp. 51]|uniref:hypothetical protein n=1 Tax=Bacteroides sp. 51 TaxID=2302938 RepID=UPI0013CF9FD2|nr:hypothetical protein [Bacteroides sp. 51]NDV81762.1 hypothetical protein [Bacteroides sp. 51]